MKTLLLVLVASLLFFAANAQRSVGTVKGTLIDSASKEPLSDATISVVRTSDSTLVSFALTDSKGFFEIKNLQPGMYTMIAAHSSIDPVSRPFVISKEKLVSDLGMVTTGRHYKTMDAVVITQAPVMIKGDTIAYNADAFKTKPNATVEDLLKKLPGVSVDKDGTVKAQGEQVQKVYVDGKEFFNNDPKMATKNLTADMVDQVEVFDDMSEQAKFNKIDDGSRTKAINLKLKKDKKKGLFGKLYAGYGTEERYDAGVNANLFKGATQVSLIAKSNNTNNIGFTFSDVMGMFGGGGMASMNMGGAGASLIRNAGAIFGGMGGNFSGFNMGGGGSGITTSSQAGLNYRDTWSKLFDVNGSYSLNVIETDNSRRSLRQTFASDTAYINDQLTNSRNRNPNHRVNMNFILTFDSLNSIIYNPSVQLQSSRSHADDTVSYDRAVKGSVQNMNESRSVNDGTGEGLTWNNNLIYRRKFHRRGRTFSISLANTLDGNDRNNYNVIQAVFNSRNVYTRTDNSRNNYNGGFSYTEPVGKNKIFEINYNYAKNSSGSDRRAYQFNTSTARYDLPYDSLSNSFENLNEIHRAGMNFRVSSKKVTYQLGVSAQQAQQDVINFTRGTTESQKFINYFPTASFSYQFTRARNFRLNYRGSTRQPTATQLQEVLDISNVPYFYIGNAGLRQEFSNNVTISYSFFDIVKFRNLFVFATLNNTYRKISNSITINPDGTQVTRPVNLEGAYTGVGNFNIGFPLKRLKGGNINSNTRLMLSQDPSLFNGRKTFTKNMNVGEDLRFSYNHQEKFDMGLTATVSYTSVIYANEMKENVPQQDQSYFTHMYSADLTYTPGRGFIISTDFDYTFNRGRVGDYNRDFAMWNGSIAKEFLKNKRGELRVSVFDILNQNTSVSRNTGANYVEDTRSMVLNRFYMLTLTYKLNRMAGKTLPPMIERATKDIRIMQ